MTGFRAEPGGPSRRVEMNTTAGHRRMEDKIVQNGGGTILLPIYEPEFLGFSYGFRPGRA